jgi:transposase
MHGPDFLLYIETVLVPVLRKGDIVVMDNLQTHKVKGVIVKTLENSLGMVYI